MQLYKEIILDNYRNPRNKGKIENPTVMVKSNSSESCGDSIELYVNIKDDKITEIKHITKGCALNQASISILSEYVKNKNIKEILKISPNKFYEILNITPSISRVNCVLLSLNTLKRAINEYKKASLKRKHKN